MQRVGAVLGAASPVHRQAERARLGGRPPAESIGAAGRSWIPASAGPPAPPAGAPACATRRAALRARARRPLGRDDCGALAGQRLVRSDPFGPYAWTAIHRACWRYVVSGQRTRPAVLLLEDAGERLELTAPSAEAEAIAREAVRRAMLPREHAARASSRGDLETTARLREAATTAAALAAAPGRRRRARDSDAHALEPR